MQTSLSPFLMAWKDTPLQITGAKTDLETTTNRVFNLNCTLKNDTLEIHSPRFSGEKAYIKLKQPYGKETLYGECDDGKPNGKVGYFILGQENKPVFIQVPEHLVNRQHFNPVKDMTKYLEQHPPDTKHANSWRDG